MNQRLSTRLRAALRRGSDRFLDPLLALWQGIIPWPRPGSDAFRTSVADLATSREDLQAVVTEVEKRFLAITSSLETLPAISEDMVAQSERLLGLASGKQEGSSAFQSALELLKAPLAFIDHCQEQNRQLTGQLQAAMVKIDRMLGYEATLQRTVAPLKFIQTLFKVESASLPHTVQLMFLALTEDIDRLQQQVNQTFGAKFELLRNARHTIRTVVSQLQETARTQDAAARAKKQAIQRALDELQSELKRNEDRDIQLTFVTRAINQEVGRIVMSLQAQDIVSQKMAHVLQAVASMETRLQGYSGDPKSGPATMAFCRDASRVQAGQLQAIQQDLRGAATTMEGAVTAIRQQIATLDKDCLCLKELDTVTVGVHGLVQVLLDTMGDVRSTVTAAVRSAEHSYTAIRPIGGLASNVTGTMRQLSAQIHLIALNAQVQAAHIGSGTGLEILAAGTATIAAETTSISENVARELDTLTASLAEHVGSFENLHQRGTGQQEALDAGQQAQESGLHAFRDQTLSVLSLVSEAVQRIETVAASMGQELNFESSVDPLVTRGHATFENIARVSEEWLTRRGVAALQPTPGDLAHSYTMVSERAVYDAILGRHEPTAPIAASGTGSADAPELFGDAAVVTAPSSSPAGAPAPTLTAPRTSPAPAAAAPASTPAPAAAKFGDNVELF